MGMCAISGPRVMSADEELEQESTSSATSSAMSTVSMSDDSSSQDLIDTEGVDSCDQVDFAIWKRTIPKGRRCKPLSFSGIIDYDENGNQVRIHEGDDDSWHTEDWS